MASAQRSATQSSTHPNDDDLPRQKGATTVDAFVAVRPIVGLTLSVNPPNLFNTFGQVEKTIAEVKAWRAAHPA